MDKRTDYISWDEYFMGVAHLAALRSKDPNTQRDVPMMNSRGEEKEIRTIPSIFIQRTANSMQSSITGEAAWREQSFMFRSFRATSVPKRSFSAESEP